MIYYEVVILVLYEGDKFPIMRLRDLMSPRPQTSREGSPFHVSISFAMIPTYFLPRRAAKAVFGCGYLISPYIDLCQFQQKLNNPLVPQLFSPRKGAQQESFSVLDLGSSSPISRFTTPPCPFSADHESAFRLYVRPAGRYQSISAQQQFHYLVPTPCGPYHSLALHPLFCFGSLPISPHLRQSNRKLTNTKALYHPCPLGRT